MTQRQVVYTVWICWTKDWFTSQVGQSECDSMRFHHAAQRSMQFKTYESVISRIFHIIFLNLGWAWESETSKSKAVDKWGDYCTVRTFHSQESQLWSCPSSLRNFQELPGVRGREHMRRTEVGLNSLVQPSLWPAQQCQFCDLGQILNAPSLRPLSTKWKS